MMMFVGRRDREPVLPALQIGIVDCIAKPYDSRVFLERVEKALRTRTEQTTEQYVHTITQMLKEVTQIPTLSPIFAKVQELLGVPEPSVDAVSRVIENDPAITMRVLRFANSAYFGFKRQVKRINEALALIGFQAVRNVVLAMSTFEALGQKKESAGLDKVGLWQHAVGTAEITLILENKLNLKEGGSFSGGLLHDIGKIILDTFFP